MHGPDSGLLHTVARKAEAILREHLHDNNVLVEDAVKYKEPEDESMLPCNSDVEFGDVDSSCGHRLSPTIAPATEVKRELSGTINPSSINPILCSTGESKTPANNLRARTQRELGSKE